MRVIKKWLLTMKFVSGSLLLLFIFSAITPLNPAIAAEKIVKLGVLTFETGPVADCGLPSAIAASDLVRYINETGGIKGTGVKIDLVRIDHGYNMSRAITAYDKMVYNDKVLGIASWGSTPNDALKQKVGNDKIPMVDCGGSSALIWPLPNYQFSAGGSYSDMARGILKWVKEVDWPKQGKARKPRLGIVMPDNPFGWAFANGVVSGGLMLGFDMSPIQFEPLNVMDATGTSLNLKKFGVDYIWGGYTQHGYSVIARDAQRAGIIPPAKFLVYASGIDPSVIPRSEGALSGSYFASFYAGWSDAKVLPHLKKFKDAVLRYHPSADPEQPFSEGCYFAGAASMGLLIEGVSKAIEQVGYEKLTPQAVAKGIESLKDVNLMDIMKVDNMSVNDHRASQKLRVWTITSSGEIKVISDWFTAPDGPAWEHEGKMLPKDLVPR